jgi:hypothetical protein
MQNELEASGFTIRAAALSEASLTRLLAACAAVAGAQQVRHPSGGTYGLRGLLWSSAALGSELEASGLSTLASAALGGSAFPIDAIFFDKCASANWSVPGHQDRLMPVESGSVAPRSVRNGIEYIEPSCATLAKLVALRVHFDDVDGESGALEVVPGSHRSGVLPVDAIREVPLADYRPCLAARGDVLLMRPLLLHRSGRRKSDGHRRVLHVVYASEHVAGEPRWKSSA